MCDKQKYNYCGLNFFRYILNTLERHLDLIIGVFMSRNGGGVGGVRV